MGGKIMKNEEIVNVKLTNEEFKEELLEQISEFDKEIDNIGKDNIINHSSLHEAETSYKLINKNIKRADRTNKLVTCLKNVKILGRLLQGGFPYIVVAGLVFTGQTLLGDVPFYPQKNEFKVAQHEQIIDKTGVIDEKVSYIKEGTGDKNQIQYTTKWEKKADGNYYRATQTYEVENFTAEHLKEMINDPTFNFEETFGRSKSNKYEVKKESELTPKDLEEEAGFKIIYHYTDDLDVILGAQDTGTNVGLSFLYVFITFLGTLPVLFWRMEESDYDFGEHLERIKDEAKASKIDIEEIKRLFNEKKIKFELVKKGEISLTDPITGEVQVIKKK